MCTIIQADYLLACILSTEERIKVVDLRELRREIEKKCEDVVVDISSPSINSALMRYPKVFHLQEDQIIRRDDSDKYLKTDYFDNVFCSSVPSKVHCRVKGLIAKAMPRRK